MRLFVQSNKRLLSTVYLSTYYKARLSWVMLSIFRALKLQFQFCVFDINQNLSPSGCAFWRFKTHPNSRLCTQRLLKLQCEFNVNIRRVTQLGLSQVSALPVELTKPHIRSWARITRSRDLHICLVMNSQTEVCKTLLDWYS